MSARQLTLYAALRFGVLTVEHGCLFTGLGAKALERALMYLRRDELIWNRPWLDGRKLYFPTARAARLHGADDRRFRHAPNAQGLAERLALLMFAAETGHEILTKAEFAKILPNHAACGVCHTRYFIDRADAEQPVLSLVMPDYGTTDDARGIARKVLREVERRKQHQPFQDLIYVDKLFAIVVTTAFADKAEAIEMKLKHLTLPHAVVVVPGMRDLVWRETE